MEHAKNLPNSDGLMPDDLLFIISQIESKTVSTPEKIKLMTRLIPQQSVPEEAFIRMTCLLCDFKFNMNLKVEILKWMMTVYSFVDNLTNFVNLIELFIQLLEHKKLRPYVCELLLQMTRKEHVTVQRVNTIAELLQRVEPEPCLIPLMFTFCKLMTMKEIELKEQIKCEFDARGIYPGLIKKVHPSFDASIPVRYIINNDDSEPLPPVCVRVEKPSQSEICSRNENALATLPDEKYEFLAIYREFKSMEKQKVEKILQNKYRRLFFSCFTKMKKTSVEDFILVSMYRNSKNIDLLRDTLEFFHEIQKSVPGICGCMEKIIEHWDGSSGLDVILGMLSYEPLCCFEKFQYLIELILEKLINSSVLVKCDLISGLSDLYQEWVLRDQNSVASCENCICPLLDNNSIISDDQSITTQIYKLGNYILYLCDAFLLDHNFNVCLLNEILLHNEKVSRSHSFVKDLVIHPPSTITFHAALFTWNSVILESLFKLMTRYQNELKCMRENKHPEFSLGEIYFKRYSNDILMLLLNAEYRGITHLSKENVIPRLKAEHPNFEKYFEVFRHPALMQKTALFIENFEMDLSLLEFRNVPVVRDKYFKFLEENNLACSANFLKKLLKQRRKK